VSGLAYSDALYSDLCAEGVTRRGEYQPCEKPSVGLRRDPQEGGPYPVCAFHARSPMVTLPEIVRAVRGIT
jgi:hypothetical protein